MCVEESRRVNGIMDLCKIHIIYFQFDRNETPSIVDNCRVGFTSSKCFLLTWVC